MGDKTIAGQLLAMKTPKGVFRTDVQMGRDAAFDEAAALVAALDAAEARDVGARVVPVALLERAMSVAQEAGEIGVWRDLNTIVGGRVL